MQARSGSRGRRLGRPSHLAWPQVARVARPRRFERQKSTDKGARDGPSRDFRRFRVDFAIDFQCFSRQHCASDVTRSASGRTLDFADRCGTLERSQTLRKARKSTTIDGKSLRRRFANEPRGKNRFLRSWARLGVDFGGSEAFPGAPGMSSECSWAPRGVPRGSWDRL